MTETSTAHADGTGSEQRRRRRSTFAMNEKAWWGAVLAVAAVLAVLSPGSPTGHEFVDAVYRTIFVLAVAAASSRARRWTMIVAAAIVTASSIGLGLLFGAVALVMAVVLVWRDLRNRVYGSCVGVFVAMACLRLDVGVFTGASVLVAAVAAGLILWSGYQVSRRKTRRLIRWVALGAGVVAVIGVGLGIYQAIVFSSPLQSAVDSTIDGISAVQNGDTAAGSDRFAAAAREFREVADDAGSPWLFPARLVPVVGQNVEVISVMSDAGASLTDAARRTTSEVDYGRLRREGGGVDIGVLETFLEPVADTSVRLAAASKEVEGLDSPWVVGPLAERIDQFETKVDDLRSQTDLALAALQYGPGIFGADGERRYLVLLGNPAEARDLGGHIGNWAELTMLDGKISLVEVGRPLELAQSNLDNALQESGDLPPSFLGMRPARFPQNWGASLDFPVDARVAARLFETKTGRRIDGVLYADPFALAAMLGITGPIEVPGLPGKSLASGDAVRFLTLDQFVAFTDPSVGDEAVTELVRALFQRLTETTLPSPATLGAQFGPLVKSGRFRMVSLHDADRGILSRVGLDAGFEPVEGDDFLAVVSRNANPSKIDGYLHRTTSYEVDWDPETGAVEATISVELRNDAPADGLPPYVIGNSAGFPNGTNVTDLAVLTPFEATRATVDGIDANVSTLLDLDHWRHNIRVEVPPGSTVKVTLGLEGDVRNGDVYRLRFGAQPLVNEGTTEVTVRADARRIRGGRGIKVSDSEANLTLSEIGRTILTLRAEK